MTGEYKPSFGETIAEMGRGVAAALRPKHMAAVAKTFFSAALDVNLALYAIPTYTRKIFDEIPNWLNKDPLPSSEIGACILGLGVGVAGLACQVLAYPEIANYGGEGNHLEIHLAPIATNIISGIIEGYRKSRKKLEDAHASSELEGIVGGDRLK